MNEESDNPISSGVVQSTPMEFLNYELTPKTDESQSEPEDTKKGSIPTKLFQHAESIISNSKPSEFILHAKFTEISKLGDDEEVYSQPTLIDGIAWKIGEVKSLDGEDIEFYLHAELEHAVEWYCPVIAEFRVISQKSKEIIHRTERNMFFDAEDCWDSLADILIKIKNLDEEKKFFVNDSINIAVAIRSFPTSFHETTRITLRSQFSDISKLTKDDVFSEPTEIEGIAWKMSVCKRTVYGEGIYVYLHAKEKDAVGWWYPVVVDVHLESQKTGKIVHMGRTKNIYDGAKTVQWTGTISKMDLLHEEMGFVKNDSIIVVMDVNAFPVN